MIHHTILTPAAIFGTNHEFPQLVQCTYLGQNVEVFKMSDDSMVINRIISTDPSIYLRPEFQPGCKLKDPNLY